MNEEGVPYTDVTNPVIDHPEDVSFIIGELNQKIVWNPTEDYPDYYFMKINGIEEVSHSWNGGPIIFSLENFIVGEYDVECVVYDFYGNWASDIEHVKVEAQKADYFVYIISSFAFVLIVVVYINVRQIKQKGLKK